MAITFEMDGRDYVGEPLTTEENRVFNEHFDTYIAPLNTTVKRKAMSVSNPLESVPVRNEAAYSEEYITRQAADQISAFLQERKNHVRAGVMVAKNILGGAFKGVHGNGTELVFSHIMPWHLLRTQGGTETPATSWDNFLASQGAAWANGADYWIGYNTNNATAANIDKRVLVLILGVAELSTNRPVQRIQFTVDNVTYTPQAVQQFLALAPSADRVPIAPLKTLLLNPKSQVSAQIYTDAAVASILMPIGIAVGIGTYMSSNYISTVSL